MFYHEQRTQLGRWSPVTTPERPEQHKSGRLLKVGGLGPMIRGVRAVPPHHQHLPLSELRRIYGVRDTDEDHTAAVDGIEDAELVEGPVFRSGRVSHGG